jgi:hypothetical protein
LSAGVSAKDLRRPYWQRPWHGVVRLAGHDETSTYTRVCDAIALLPPGCALGGWASLWWHGVPYVDGYSADGNEMPVLLHMVHGHQLRPRAGVTPSRAALPGTELATVDGVLVSTLARAAFDCMAEATTVADAVVVADMTLSRLLPPWTTRDDITDVLVCRPRARGRVRALQALALCCDRSLSPWETRVRIFADDVLDVARWEVNAPVFDYRGHLAGVVDLLDPYSGLAVEWDGAQHRRATAHAADNVRTESYADLGMVVVRVSAPDWRDKRRLRHRLVMAHRRAAALPLDARRWTLDKPSWWGGSRAASLWE